MKTLILTLLLTLHILADCGQYITKADESLRKVESSNYYADIEVNSIRATMYYLKFLACKEDEEEDRQYGTE